MDGELSKKREAWARLLRILCVISVVIFLMHLVPNVIAQGFDDDDPRDPEEEVQGTFCCFSLFFGLFGVIFAVYMIIPLLVLLFFFGGIVISIILVIKIMNKDRSKEKAPRSQKDKT